MLISELKERDSFVPLVQGKTLIICCEGCREIYFPDDAVEALRQELLGSGSAAAAVCMQYICNPKNVLAGLLTYADKLEDVQTILVFSCGVGVQVVAELCQEKIVLAACDIYPLPGAQGLTPLEYDCEQCGDCHLNNTGGICPISACSKGLVNGQCGGAKNGMCETDSTMECGWETIFRRQKTIACDITIRSYISRSCAQ